MDPLPAVSNTTSFADAAIVIHQARWKAALLLAGSAAFVAIGVVMVRDPTAVARGWLCIAVFGLGALVGVAQLVRRGRLTLSPAGVTLEHLGRDRSWRWDRVENFRVWRMRRTQLVTFDDLDAKPGALQRINAELGAGSSALPSSWAIKPQALAELLEDCRRRWG